MKRIPLRDRSGKIKFWTSVDDDWFDFLNQWKWCSQNCSGLVYAIRAVYYPKIQKQKTLFMHRLVAQTPKGLVTDHINHDTLDNRSENLRAVNNSINRINYGLIPKNNSTGTIGIYRINREPKSRRKNKWVARLTRGEKLLSLGQFKKKKDAVQRIEIFMKFNL